MSAVSGSVTPPVYRQVSHTLASYPGELQVLTRATSGVNSGYIFYGISTPQSDNDEQYYGGLAFGYSDSSVSF
jgi:hypothetical protein